MTQLWKGDNVIPVTKLVAGPCTVTQIKTEEKDGYKAVQIAFGSRRTNVLSKALLGHFKNLGAFRYVREVRFDKKDELGELKTGDLVSAMTFNVGDKVTLVGVSKGKGFQGVVKRHGFHGQDATHGNKDQLRASGSVGAGGIQHVLKGTRMSGRMGGDRVTLHDVEIVEIDEKNNVIYVKGAVPGARHGLVMLFGEGELKLGLPTSAEATVGEPEEEKVEEKPQEEVETRTTENSEKTEDTEKATEAPIEEESKVEEPVAEVKESTPAEVLVDEEQK